MLFQRWAAVEERKVNQVLGLSVQPTGRLQTGREVARFVAKHLRDADDIIAELVRDCAQFMNQPLQDFGRFVNDVLERLEKLQRRALIASAIAVAVALIIGLVLRRRRSTSERHTP